MSKLYTCDNCGGTFEARWSEAEALEEEERVWGEHLGEDRAELCEVCYREFMAWFAQSGIDPRAPRR